MMKLVLGSVLVVMLALPAHAGDLTVRVKNISDELGQVRVTVCKEDEFKQNRCALAQSAQAFPPMVSFVFPGVAPGPYAIKAYHDRNNNDELDRGFLGFVPIEGYGFSRMLDKVRKPPEFADVVIPVGSSDTVYEVLLNYP
ncbi:MAG: DUF2141 domain-containing protein [Proteobacteria bacterium]|nr:DUF2141 domain-containing protein [Pseudomonadota bacterium]